MASVGAENVKVHVLPPKNDTHGLGFDPFKVCTSILNRSPAAHTAAHCGSSCKLQQRNTRRAGGSRSRPALLQGAEDFRAAKRGRDQPDPRVPAAKRTRGVAFGTGVMDEDDVYGLTDDYVVDPESKDTLDFELHSDEDAEPVPRQATAPDIIFRSGQCVCCTVIIN